MSVQNGLPAMSVHNMEVRNVKQPRQGRNVEIGIIIDRQQDISMKLSAVWGEMH